MSRYKSLGMMKDAGMQKDINDYMSGSGTAYLLSNQRGAHLVTTNAHHLLVQGLMLLDTSAAHNGEFIFVMDGDGNIYSADKFVVSHHSAFLAGGPAAAAGHWQVTNGIVQWVNNVSGHYHPPIDYAEQIIKELKRRHISVDGIQKNWMGLKSKASAKASKKTGITFKRMGEKGVIQSRF